MQHRVYGIDTPIDAMCAPALLGAVGAPGEFVTLCGSMRFFPQMLEVAAELTGRDVIVLAPFRVVPAGEQRSAVKVRLDALHRRKIALSDAIVVVTDASGYIGESTRAEIAYATSAGKPVHWARITTGGDRA